jgi:hypothetical protein
VRFLPTTGPLLALALLFSCRTGAAPEPAPPPLARSRVVVVTADGRTLPVEVELATDEAQRARGLMFREKLGAEDGMLFLFDEEQPLAFWMRNTLIPLDMLFVRSDGTVLGIVENAVPRSETPRRVKGHSRYVLEVNGGWSARHGVKAGDRVELAEALAAVATARAK